MMNNRGTAGSSPRARRLSMSACTTAEFSVAPSISPSGCFTPLPSMPIPATSTSSPVTGRRARGTPTPHHQPAGHLDAVDLPHQQIELGQVRSHPLLHAGRRERHEMPRGRRLRYSTPGRRRNIALRQSDRAPTLARPAVDTHQVHRPATNPTFLAGLLPAWERQFLPVEPADPRPLDCDLAGVEADLARCAPPAMTAPLRAARMPWPTSYLGVRLHHRAQCLEPGRQGDT